MEKFVSIPGRSLFPLLPVLCKSHSSHSPLICIFIIACYFTRTWRCMGGLMSVLAYISILQESVLFPSLPLLLQSVTFAGKLSFTQWNRQQRLTCSLMCQSDYVSSYFTIIHLFIVFTKLRAIPGAELCHIHLAYIMGSENSL